MTGIFSAQHSHAGNAVEDGGLYQPLLLETCSPHQMDDGINERPGPLDVMPEEDGNTRMNGRERSISRLVDGMPLETSLLLKVLYFLEALGSSTWGRFGTIYYNLHGLNSQQIGILEGLMPAVKTVSQPLWGVVADKFHCRKLLYLLTKTVSTMILLCLALPFVYATFGRILVVSLAAKAFVSGGILDSYTLELLGTENKLRYGRYRVWSSISWGIGAILMGYITDHFGFEPNFLLYGILGGLSMAVIALRIPDVEKEQQESDSGKVMDLLRLAVRPRVLIFLMELVVVGAGMGTVDRLLFLYLVNDLGASTLLCGLSVGANVIFEVPIFWYAKSFMAVLGHDGMFAVSMFCFVIRVFGYTLLTPSTRWLILPLEAMHGVTFGCFWVTATDVAKALIDKTPGWNTTIPSVVQTLFSAVGVGLGSIVGGWAMHKYGSREMYRGMGSIMLLTLLIHIVGSIGSHCFWRQSLLPNHEGKENHEKESVTKLEEPLLETEPTNVAP